MHSQFFSHICLVKKTKKYSFACYVNDKLVNIALRDCAISTESENWPSAVEHQHTDT